mmetsp:Transcript_14759/g.41788  ORF Transcript_14759/g.41788 Transcript_14759/m.41788 type:complete len:425 (+) Transcript_14759:187-1461(+)|eukprot:CAMPEP_0119564204 /NCGR_PEP_ID=MMETSP1352-20130426/26188_1 /TAXON_ID=265584 /ORGANISM="Stauroneis constricta, Strain CCMP1120" /LENGTH=424 /DNA_ID=CAMNT_0007612933 /DNA_START=122 /DNA_END=1392 /DNA_ORIENTATION=+
MNKLAVLLLAAAASPSASAFVLNEPNHAARFPSAVVTTTFAAKPPSPHGSLFSSKAAESVGAEQSQEESGLLPEYEAALQKAVGLVKATLDDKPQLVPALEHFCKEYITASQASFEATKDDASKPDAAFQRIVEGLQYGFKFGMGPDKFIFDVTHDALRGNPETEDGNTLDFYKWGCEFFRPMMDIERSVVNGMDNLKQAAEQVKNGENVVFLANHQSEADPQVVSTLLEKAGFPDEAEKVYFVAGHKVTTDALAIPFSMGRNLICIHSKKHIDADPDKKPIKNRQNLAAMNGMLNKLKAGGCILWVAPSGGRDRRDVESGKTPIAPFDTKTVDMFRLMGKKCKQPTHYYPMATVSYELCPPPDFIEAGVGEQRNFRFVPVGLTVGDEIVEADKAKFSELAYQRTLEEYSTLRGELFPGTEPEL